MFLCVCVGGQQCIQFTPSSHLAHSEWMGWIFPSFLLIISRFMTTERQKTKTNCGSLNLEPPFEDLYLFEATRLHVYCQSHDLISLTCISFVPR